MTEYMKNLRKLVGHTPVMLCGASVIVENESGEILLQLRRDNQCWGYAGGAIELGESTEDAAKRELFEETGLVANTLELFGVFSGEGQHYKYPNGDEVHIIDIVYLCRDYSGNLIAQKEEVNELRFFKWNQLPEKLSPPIIKAINAYISEKADRAKENL